jgi:hypothetical protein
MVEVSGKATIPGLPGDVSMVEILGDKKNQGKNLVLPAFSPATCSFNGRHSKCNFSATLGNKLAKLAQKGGIALC